MGTIMNTASKKSVLVCGASIAGLTTAYWLKRIGYQVTVVEMAGSPREGGAAVDLGGRTIEVIKRMGIYDPLKARALTLERIEFKNAEDITENAITVDDGRESPVDDQIEIERTQLMQVLMSQLANEVAFKFGDSITALDESPNDINVTFRQGGSQRFELVIGCDGVHSGVRKLWFGAENEYKRFLGAYFSLSIVDKLLITPNTMQFYNVPGKVCMLNTYRGKTDIVFCFLSDEEISYDYRDTDQQKKTILAQFARQGWRTAELLAEISDSGNFYFDQLCQIKMPSWSKGRVALVGDAAYAPSPGAGMGGSLAMDGAAALADALLRHEGDYQAAFADYHQHLHPYIDEVQAQAELNIRGNFIPRTQEAIRQRNQGGQFQQNT
jgi:2-polyprenyl-6-methoxyphenol hydroxylase-like FAD-dependent oxidoreductase